MTITANLSEYSLVDKADLGLGGRLYPEDMIIEARGAKVSEIRHWANINDQDILDVRRHITDIITSCVRVSSASEEHQYSPKDLYEFDQTALLLIINQLTFADTKKHNIFTKAKCGNAACGKAFDNLPIQPSNIMYTELDERFEKYIDTEHGGFLIKTKSYGDIAVKPSTIGLGMAITEWVRTFDADFVRSNMNMFSIVSLLATDWRKTNNKALRLLQVEQYNNMTPDKLSFYTMLYEKTSVQPKDMLEFICPDCGARFQSRLQFEGGYRAMFLPVQDTDAELL